MKSVGDARRAYEAAKMLADYHVPASYFHNDARLLLTNAEAEYRAALIDAQLRKFDGLGIKVGETVVDREGVRPFVIGELAADVYAGRVKAWSNSGGGWSWADTLRPYTAPEAKQMVLYGAAGHIWCDERHAIDRFRLTLSGITPADLDAMKPGDVIEGTFKIEGVGK